MLLAELSAKNKHSKGQRLPRAWYGALSKVFSAPLTVSRGNKSVLSRDQRRGPICSNTLQLSRPRLTQGPTSQRGRRRAVAAALEQPHSAEIDARLISVLAPAQGETRRGKGAVSQDSLRETVRGEPDGVESCVRTVPNFLTVSRRATVCCE